MRCLFCLMPTMEIRSDKKGRPYMTCTSCSVRVFPRGRITLAVYATIAELLDQRPDQLAPLREAAMLRAEAAYQDRTKKGLVEDGDLARQSVKRNVG